MRTIEEDIPEDEEANEKENIQNNAQSEDVDSDDDILVLEDHADVDPTKPVSVAELFAKRQAEIQKQKFRIGVYCSGLLETPEKKVKNFNELLHLLDDSTNGITNIFTVCFLPHILLIYDKLLI